MRYKILKCLNTSNISYVCFDNQTNCRSYHLKTLIESIENCNTKLELLEKADKIDFDNREIYELIYEFESFEEFKEQYPEEFV